MAAFLNLQIQRPQTVNILEYYSSLDDNVFSSHSVCPVKIPPLGYIHHASFQL